MTDASAPTPPESVEAATALLERYAELYGKAQAVSARRNVLLARANAAADKLITPFADEAGKIRALLEPWWSANAKALTQGKRKSIELGGCMIGSKAGPASLISALATFDKQAEAMRKLPWATPYVRVTVAIDKAAVKKGLIGPDAVKLKRRGFSIAPGADEFFVERVAQAGTVGGTAKA